MRDQIIKLRRDLHRHPELSGAEVETAQRIKDFVVSHRPSQVIDNIGGHGLAVIYDFDHPGPTVMIRCELDALPIEETNNFDYRSANTGVSHKCGHDGHMTIVAGLTSWINKQGFNRGKVVLLFQPAEETGRGAYEMLSDLRITSLDPDYIFALHNIPGLPMGAIVTVRDHFSATVESMSVDLTGKECHAAEPEQGLNPAIAIGEIIDSLSALNVLDPNRPDFSILTPVHITMGEKSYGLSPAMGELHYTIRAWSTPVMSQLKKEIDRVITTICADADLECRLNWFEYFPATENNESCNKIVKKAALNNNFQVIERPYPFRFGEDFGWFSQSYKAAMFGIGAGEDCPALHHADYDFPEELLEVGMQMFRSIIEDILS